MRFLLHDHFGPITDLVNNQVTMVKLDTKFDMTTGHNI